ncbi:wax ester/triacylglycerol synthase family O-acyltransferase [Rhodoferax sp. AJA081-3]|uniref:wax ester/triacylglycerol synthase family O-acyltransferase n=1 Tax=Rhodoferax sp. AJA081-3 TaxID=2752316 RepID=UPI001ADF1679|nr:wax ester/triacylglycerol synthase family O-acyltransferase [Rhodoferax sp. AJA081-3]QTN29170.1 wax ester/triacylglycerol synthase family O-acyltransferase [Rhodoferax sp. AJA081-3]
MSKLSLLDLGFFIAETEASPKHVAGLLIFKRPPKSTPAFAKNLFKEYLAASDVKPPFNRVIQFTMGSWPYWQPIEKLDMSQHVFFHTMPKGANDRAALYAFVSQLHTPMLDRSRPLWEVHVIDGLPDGKFALYQKMHHAYADGVTMARWTAECYSTSPTDMDQVPVWTQKHGGHGGSRSARAKQELLQMTWKEVTGNTRRFLGIGRLAAMLLLESVKLTKNAIALPFVSSAKTPLTGQVTSGRQFATAGVSMERVNAIRTRTRSTLNHIALTCLDGALRRYLQDQGVELRRPITIQMPVNLRKEGEKTAGNKIGIIQVELSPPTDDPYVRLRNIGYSLRNVRTMVDSVAPEAIESYTIITGLVAQIAETLKLSNKMPPMGNTLVSNVPGPKEHLYIKGARMEEMHPISTLPPSNLLNITLFSYAGDLFFGLIATDELPNLERLGVYVEEAFGELEASVRDAHM